MYLQVDMLFSIHHQTDRGEPTGPCDGRHWPGLNVFFYLFRCATAPFMVDRENFHFQMVAALFVLCVVAGRDSLLLLVALMLGLLRCALMKSNQKPNIGTAAAI